MNAFCLPGGKIVVYTGIVPVAQNEAALATVMGHEMAHATSRHGAQRVLQQNLAQTAMTGIAVSLSDMDYDKQRAVMGALGAGAQFGILMPFGRKHESEADRDRPMYMARAGYDPQESIRFWERMEQAGGRILGISFDSSVPRHAHRATPGADAESNGGIPQGYASLGSPAPSYNKKPSGGELLRGVVEVSDVRQDEREIRLAHSEPQGQLGEIFIRTGRGNQSPATDIKVVVLIERTDTGRKCAARSLRRRRQNGCPPRRDRSPGHSR